MDSTISDILRKNSTIDVEFYTHTGMFNPTGKYLISRDNYDRFMKKYSKCIFQNDETIAGITEKPGTEIPLLVDVDLYVKEDDLNDREKLYEVEHIMNLIEIYHKVLKHMIKDCSDNTLLCCVLEKEMYKDDKNPKNIRYKNGFHLHFPNCILDRDTIKEYIIPAVKEEIKYKNFFSHLNLSLDEIIDDAVIRNPWLLYGSRKSPNHKPYLLTRIYDYKLEQCGFEVLNNCEIYDSKGDMIEFSKDISYYLPYILSIHPTYRKISKIKDDIITYKIEKPNKDFKKNKKVSKSVKENLIEANKLIKIIAPWRAESFAEWLQMGWILYNISEGDSDGLEIWCKFSEKCPEKFDRFVCEDYWENKFSIRNYTIATLHYFAKQDNETAYKEIIKDKVENSLETILRYRSHNDIAKLLLLHVGSSFVCSSIKKNTWYHFNNHVWQQVEEGYSLRKMISKEITDGFKKILDNLNSQISTDPATNMIIKQKMDAVLKMIQYTGNASFKDSVLKEAREIFYDEKFLTKINTNSYLIAFKNGIYDLETNTLREGTPDDYITMKMRIKYKEFTKNDEAVKDVERFLEQIFPDTSVRKYFLDIYSEVFVGNNFAKKFLVWSGEGCNGKSVTTDIFERMLGDYSVVLPTSLITGKRGMSAGASPELSRTEGVRMAWLQEPSPDERINPGIMKELTGNDTFYARGLYQEGRDIKAMFKLVLVCNTPPKLESDQASWNRIRILPFESTFTDDAPESYEEQLKEKKFKKDTNFGDKVSTMIEAFAWYLLEHRKNKPKNFTLYEPEKVKMATINYRNRNDIYKLYISEQIDNVAGAVMELGDLYDSFKEWFKESMPGQKPPPKNTIKDEFTKIWGAPNENSIWIGFKQKPPKQRIISEENNINDADYEIIVEEN